MKIIHFSDSHAGGGASDWTAFLDKRWVGIFNYKFRRKYQHDLSLLRKAVEYIAGSGADIAVCTGDLTSTGQPGEFRETLEILAPLLDGPVPLVYVPGNHDFYVFNGKCTSALLDSFRKLNGGLFSLSDLPARISFGGCDFLLVNECGPTNLFSSCGHLSARDSDIIANTVKERKERPVILVGHYPIIERHPVRRLRHRLWGQARVAELLEDGQIDISLCGHMHKPYFIELSPGRGEICSGSVTRNACMAEITWNPADKSFSYRKIAI